MSASPTPTVETTAWPGSVCWPGRLGARPRGWTMPGRCWPVGLVLVKRPLLVALALAGAGMLWLGMSSSALALSLTVDTTSDNPALQACTAAAFDCSLRGAILRANAVAGPHTITLPAGEYDLTGVSPGGYNTDGAAAGNLVIAQNITINGVTPDLTTITYSNATALDHRDRIFHVLPAGNLTVSNLSVRGGGHGTASGSDRGGGVWAQGPLTMDRVSVRLNSQAFGGGVYVENTTDIHASTININSAVSGGGVFIGGFGVYTAKILNTTISSNTASNLGGGIEFDGLSPNIVATLNNETVAFNQAGNGGTGGGGLYIGTLGSLVMRNTLVAFNSGSNPSCAGTVSSQGHNLVDQSTAGPGTCGLVDGVNGDIISTADSRGLRLTGLQGNGGPTATHALGHASDALDKGDPAPPGSGGTACEATDQRGLPRTIDGDGDGISRCDIGAVEGGVWYAVDTTTDGNDPATLQVCDADLNNGNCSLRGAISRANAAETATPGTAAVITLPATGAGNPYLLAVPGTGEDQNATGDLDIRADITIVGGGANTTIVDGNQIDRLFDVKSSPANARLRLQDLTVQNGNGFVGGAIAADLPFFLLRVRMRGNTAQDGGGIWLGSTSGSITNSLIIANIATRPGGGGGGIDQFGNGTLTITNTTISGNQAQNGGNGGGIVQIQGTIHLANVTLAGNSAAEMGGLDLLGSVNVVNTLIAGNTVSSGGMHPNCGGSSIPASQGYNLVFGGDTCGSGETGAPGAKHESCCTSIAVPRPAADGGPYTLDKYQITAGRMRAVYHTNEVAPLAGVIRSMPLAGLLFTGYRDKLPNAKFVNWEDPVIKFDRATPVDGAAIAWGRYQQVFTYDSSKIQDPPKSFQALGEWIKKNPGRFTYAAPPDFTGTRSATIVIDPAIGVMCSPHRNRLGSSLGVPTPHRDARRIGGCRRFAR